MRFFYYIYEAVSQVDKEEEISGEKIHPKDHINGITREKLGYLVIKGRFSEARQHVIEGIARHGILKIQDAVRNELMNEFMKARKLPLPEKEMAINNMKHFEEILRKVFEKHL